MTIEVKCSRCGMHYGVADNKAGKRGRCPTCGGPIHVPTLGEAGDAYHRSHADKHLSHMIAWTAVSIVAAIMLLTVILVFREESPRKAPPPAPTRPQTPSPPRAPGVTAPRPTPPAGGPESPVAAGPQPPSATSSTEAGTGTGTRDDSATFLIRYTAEQLGEYRALLARERRLRARDVLRKIRNYEPVQMEEYKLRREVTEEAATLAAEGEDTSRWRLDEPLSDSERKELAELSERLQVLSNDLKKEFDRIGVQVASQTDLYGRTLINVEQAQEKLEALQ